MAIPHAGAATGRPSCVLWTDGFLSFRLLQAVWLFTGTEPKFHWTSRTFQKPGASSWGSNIKQVS